MDFRSKLTIDELHHDPERGGDYIEVPGRYFVPPRGGTFYCTLFDVYRRGDDRQLVVIGEGGRRETTCWLEKGIEIRLVQTVALSKIDQAPQIMTRGRGKTFNGVGIE